jgi:hypothetical protein
VRAVIPPEGKVLATASGQDLGGHQSGGYTSKQGVELHLFEYGVAVKWSANDVRAYPWATTSLYQRLERVSRFSDRITYTFWLHRDDGRVSTLSMAISGAEEWGPAIAQSAFRVRLAIKAAELRAGQTASFGEISMSKRGLLVKGQTVPWPQVKEVTVVSGLISVKVAGARNTTVTREPVTHRHAITATNRGGRKCLPFRYKTTRSLHC